MVDALTPGHAKNMDLHEALGLMSESAKLYWQALQANRPAPRKPMPSRPPMPPRVDFPTYVLQPPFPLD